MPFVDDDDFTTKVRIEQIDDRYWYTLARHRLIGSQGDVFDVPVGYRTDVTSSPRVTAPLVPRTGRHSLASILHDRLLELVRAGALSSVDADGLYRLVLAEAGVPPVKRWLMWTGVRWAALFSPYRRAGWWRTFPAVLGVTVIAFIPVGIMVLANGTVLILYGIAESIATGGRRFGTWRT